jgi:DNA-directed RNA polymerase specialized sigma24 family protein
VTNADTTMTTHGAPMLRGLLALYRRKLGLPSLSGDEAAVGTLHDAVQHRAARRFFIAGRRAPDRLEDCSDVAGDVMVRLVASPESVLGAIATSLTLASPFEMPTPELVSVAERIAASYVTTMLYNRTVELMRRRGLAVANPMSVGDIFETLDRLRDPSDLEENYDNAERRAFVARCRQELADVAERIALREASPETFRETCRQLWRLADEDTTLDTLARETGVAKAALHQRHHRAREKLLKEIDGSATKTSLDPVMALALTAVVTIHLRRRQTAAADGVSVVMAPTEEPAR